MHIIFSSRNNEILLHSISISFYERRSYVFLDCRRDKRNSGNLGASSTKPPSVLERGRDYNFEKMEEPSIEVGYKIEVDCLTFSRSFQLVDDSHVASTAVCEINCVAISQSSPPRGSFCGADYTTLPQCENSIYQDTERSSSNLSGLRALFVMHPERGVISRSTLSSWLFLECCRLHGDWRN